MDWILPYRTPELTALFRSLTFLGDPTFFLILIPLGYWLWRSELLFRFGVLLLTSSMINFTLKGIFQVPRPDVALHLTEAAGWSFPSGHAQTAATIWPWLALELDRGRRSARWATAALLVAGVAASRVYLGVHYPRDVLVGIALGLVIAFVAWRLHRHPPRGWHDLDVHLKVILGVVTVVAWILAVGFEADDFIAAAGGAFLGLWAGGLYQQRFVGFTPMPLGTRALVAVLLGLAVIFGLRVGLTELFATLGLAEGPADMLRYCAITLWIAFFAPWLFVRFGLAERRSLEDPAPRQVTPEV